MDNSDLLPILSIVGPTASGKTSLAIDIAKEYGGEIISADSMQIYKEFNIATAKPTLKELSTVKHHLIDCVSVTKEFSVAEFVELSKNIVNDIIKNHKLPILVGGTGLYVDSFLNDINFETKKCEYDLPEEFQNYKKEQLYSVLKEIDPESYKNIHVNNVKRVARAINFFYNYGYRISDQTKNSKTHKKVYNTLKLGLNFKNREILYDRINKRVDEMFERGLIDEAKLVSQLELSKTASGAIGYKEIENYLNGKQTLLEAAENLKQSTRRYAKRQLTWFRKDKEINWIYVDQFKDSSEILKHAKNIIKNWNYKI